MASSHLLLPPLCISLSAPDHSHSSSPRKALLSHSKHKQAIQTQKKPIKVNAGLQSKTVNFLLSGSLALALSFSGVGFAEGKVGVNKPEMLPKEFTTVIDVAGFLSDGQEKRLAQEIADIEKDTGFKLRVLAQNYPETPGLAIKDFWEVDDRTIVFVADPTFGNILNFNVGASVDLDIPRSFWSRLAGKYGNIFYWKEKGEDASIESAVMAISACLREPVGANNCSEHGLSQKNPPTLDIIYVISLGPVSLHHLNH
ncbi:PREDICTED: thylakoid lumenal 15.0 kDa protein 2, chloroplastic isoform X2 [Ipomoea nil]|uniref:thylakoid lumenal 15.0 kDa protein 2, chloroplastic isoform X2 n=1 Tax=Ipomoea nil TaxID=35883 RepID=UPI000901BC20|nr:PREDICTED: thylakoid lumenal 15.0 kDa protein 2, chloroplastic isoform X2 [Ipomoea nil]